MSHNRTSEGPLLDTVVTPGIHRRYRGGTPEVRRGSSECPRHSEEGGDWGVSGEAIWVDEWTCCVLRSGGPVGTAAANGG